MIFTAFYCNKCGIQFTPDDCFQNPFAVNYKFGYGSEHDGEELGYCLCPKCLDEEVNRLIEVCKINPVNNNVSKSIN